jgi:dihydroneopterin aldolase
VLLNSLRSNRKLTTETSLAYAELYLTIAGIFRQYELELFETSVEDIKMAHDFFSPFPRLDSKGVRVRVKE